MNRIKSLRKVALGVMLSFVLISCGSSMQTRVQQVQLGMSRQEVASKMGNDFKIVSMAQTEQGNLEILRYTTYIMKDGAMEPHEYYLLHFLDNKLVEMNHEDANMIQHPHPHPHPHR